MSKKCMMRREKERNRLIKKYKPRRKKLREAMNSPTVSFADKLKAQEALQKLPKDSNGCRKRNRCWVTGRARGVYRFVGLCRNMFRIHAMQGDIPGLHKASW